MTLTLCEKALAGARLDDRLLTAIFILKTVQTLSIPDVDDRIQFTDFVFFLTNDIFLLIWICFYKNCN